ncbi:MAG: Gfo/Idh/MocA family oxidoreductase [Planctomycetes bacterium]|nr:Gfo/Idh/MocA family oxidoreductase [Planctomycetota bacterium]
MATLKLGIIGAGGRGINSFGSMSLRHPKECQVVALADPNRPRMEAGLKKLGIQCDLYEKPEDLLAREDIDAVAITTPDYLHETYAVMALEAGKDVFVDKPLATTTQGCMNILEAGRKSGKLVYMGFNMRFDPVVQRLKKIVDDGELGKVFNIQSQEFYDGGKTYMARWNRLRKFSGGLFIHKGSHDLDVVNWLMGARPVRASAFANVSVLKPEGIPFELEEGETYGPNCTECQARAKCRDGFDIPADTFGKEAIEADGYVRNTCIYQSEKDTHDQGVCIVEYDGDQVASHSECFIGSITNRLYTVLGDRGTAVADLHANSIRVHPRWSKDVVEHKIARGSGGHGGADPTMFRNFLDCLLNGAEPLSNAVDGVWSVAIGEASEISRTEKRVVEISDLLDPKSDFLR